MAPLLILLLSFFIFLILNAYVFRYKYRIDVLGRLAFATMLIFTGTAHFYKSGEMMQMMPHFLPYKLELVYMTGAFEMIAAGALVLRRFTRFTSIILIIFLILILPANIIGSLKRIEIGGMESGPLYLFFRIPLQMLFVGWLYYFGIRPSSKHVKHSEQFSRT